ncbi:glycosyltransferase [Bacillus sp. CLL-7-23]|uniref:Glycosyltransferase n=1 Tax=Bacillus changyiensis TaxID=3004103 RepID=A0ABT4X3G0_9BACI|nr:glycosyltransferase [Bacillus changyiensis]MDA7026710.1 glycosyltransferase [Bacillus changyiensis]
MKDVGIVMPVYKQTPEYLEIALRSILKQSYQNFHFVIVSDGAPPETIDIIQYVTKEDDRVHLILKEKNEGVAKTLNIGFDYLMDIEEVKYFTWVSSDNFYYPDFTEKLRNALETAPENVGLAFSSFRHINANGDYLHLQQPSIEEFYKYQNQPKENLLDVCFIGVSFMYKKRFAAMIDGYHLEPVEDYEYWLRLTEVCDIVFIEEILMNYRTHSPMSVSARLRNSKIQHRRWRYAFNLARHQARQRRNIPFTLTVIYPVKDGSEETVGKLEQLLEQSYSNYKLLIIDRTLDQSAIQTLQHIEDPRVALIHLPDATEKEAVCKGLLGADTPFTLIYGKGQFPSSTLVLYNMIIKGHQMKEQSERLPFAVIDQAHQRVSTRSVLLGEDYEDGELYQTEILKSNLLEQHQKMKLPKILVNSVPKSGTHLLLQIILGIPGMRRTNFWVFEEKHLKNLKTGYVATGHFAYSQNREKILSDSDIKTIFIYRDLRDIAVSLVHFVMINKYNHPWNPYLKNGLKNHEDRLMAMIKGTVLNKEEQAKYGIGMLPNIHDFTKNFIRWAEASGICIVTFEDLVRNESSQNQTILKIIDYLWEDLQSLNISKQQLLQNMKHNINQSASDTFRKGSIGDWKEEFNASHKEVFKEIAGEFLIRLGYEKDYNW